MKNEFPVGRALVVLGVLYWGVYLAVCVTSGINPVDALLIWFR